MGSPPPREVPLAFPAPHHSAREGCPGHCGTLFHGTDVEHFERYKGQCTARSSEKMPPSVLNATVAEVTFGDVVTVHL